MRILTKEELFLNQEQIIKQIKRGVIFIHPTDTIYGISCNALDEKAVDKIKKIKEREIDYFSVWVPSLDWIKKNCQKISGEWLSKLPGPYTLITKLKETDCVASNVYNKKNKTLGIRIPKHWFHNFVEELNLPIVTTSANKTGKEFMVSLENLDPEIEKEVDFIIYEGEKKARPSKLIDLTGKVKER